MFLSTFCAFFLLFWGNIFLVLNICSITANAGMTQAPAIFFFVFASFCFKNSWFSVFTGKLF
uniref:Uncharacterized protein n=1 Tax=Oxytricha trifallax TaxID=1172189 RepID=G9HRC1_9SPIT|nr:hypothetical protein [Oxytricha trifallax]